MEKIPKEIPDTSIEDLRHEAHAFIQMFAGDDTPLAKFIYERGTANVDDCVEIYSLCNAKGLGTVHFFGEQTMEKEQTLVDILSEYLDKRGHEYLHERIQLAKQFDELIRNK
jgi:hypothetical protein